MLARVGAGLPLAVLVPLAMLSLFKKGTFARIVFVGFAVSAFVLVVTVGYLVTKQVRYAMHPQLYTEEQGSASDNALGYGSQAEPELQATDYDADQSESGGMGRATRAPAAPSSAP